MAFGGHFFTDVSIAGRNAGAWREPRRSPPPPLPHA
jgi:hypothetical protein